ncbi:MAG: hypothetical protein U0R52_06010 [Solirubrobacterales bacterium]
MNPALGHRREDLRPAAGEVLDHRPGDPLDVGVAVSGRAPIDPELAGQLGPQLGLEDVAGGLGVPIDRRAALRRGQGEPAPVALCPGQVGNQDVGVEGRVAGAAHPVAEGHRDEAPPGLDRLAAASSLHEAGLGLEVGDAGGDGAVVGGEESLPGLLRAEGVDQRDRLRRGEADVVGEHRLLGALAPLGVGEAAGRGAAQEHRVTCGVVALEDRGVGGAIELAFEAELRGELAEPLAGSFAGL